MARGEKLGFELVDLIKISRFDEAGLGFGALVFFSTIVHSWGLVVLGTPWVATVAREGVDDSGEVVLGGANPRGVADVGARGDLLARSLALDSICLVAVSRLAIWVVMIDAAD